MVRVYSGAVDRGNEAISSDGGTLSERVFECCRLFESLLNREIVAF